MEHGFHEDVKPDVYWLGLVMSEAGEAINADRKGMHADTKGFKEDLRKLPFMDSFEEHIKDSVEDEIADIVIRLLDFAGMKGYELDISSMDYDVSVCVLHSLEVTKLPGILFSLIGALSDAFDADLTNECIGALVCIFTDCFFDMTGSDKNLWWFVKKRIRYNELRPMLNGKKY